MHELRENPLARARTRPPVDQQSTYSQFMPRLINHFCIRCYRRPECAEMPSLLCWQGCLWHRLTAVVFTPLPRPCRGGLRQPDTFGRQRPDAETPTRPERLSFSRPHTRRYVAMGHRAATVTSCCEEAVLMCGVFATASAGNCICPVAADTVVCCRLLRRLDQVQFAVLGSEALLPTDASYTTCTLEIPCGRHQLPQRQSNLSGATFTWHVLVIAFMGPSKPWPRAL